MSLASVRNAAKVIATFIALGMLAAPLEGCPDDHECHDYSPPASFDPQNPAVKFSENVMPILTRSCAFTSCHGSAFGGSNGVYLGGTDAAALHKRLVDVRSSELPTMSFVKPGDPKESFLMRKLDGSQCVLDAQCTNGSCGESMPRNENVFDEDTRNIVRRWITQGAKND